MDKSFEYYKQRMGFWPSYGAPERLDEDEEFVYFRFSVPRYYIRWILEDGDSWHDYKETEEEPTLESSIVLGVRHLPVFIGIEEEGSDADFVHYRCPVPKRVMEEPVPGTDFTYEDMYTVTEKWENEEEEEAEDFEFEVPAAGTGMPDRGELNAVRKVKSETVHIYEVVLGCPDCGEDSEPYVATDLFEAVFEKSCAYCGSIVMSVVSSKAILKEDKDG
jgi:hypothetical protein